MKREVYVFMDSVSRCFGEPFTMANDAQLRRNFGQLVEDPSVPAYVVRDTVVVHLGTFVPDPDHPHIEPDVVPYSVLRGDAFNVEEIRRQGAAVAAAAPELPSN